MNITKTILFTDSDGFARFRDEQIPFTEGKPQSELTSLMSSGGYQFRHSPVGFRSEFHVTTTPQWVFILNGNMKIGLRDGSYRIFGKGEYFYSNDVLREGESFDENVHGHNSELIGDKPLITLFLRG